VASKDKKMHPQASLGPSALSELRRIPLLLRSSVNSLR
jgi:hypothetical protein